MANEESILVSSPAMLWPASPETFKGQLGAQAIPFGGHFLRHVLDPSMISLDDLWRQPPALAPTALARAWAFATTHPRHYVSVMFDGIGRTSLDLWLPSLVEEASSTRRPANLLLFASLGGVIIERPRIPEHFGDLVIPVLPDANSEISLAMVALFLGICLGIVWWIFRTGYRLKP